MIYYDFIGSLVTAEGIPVSIFAALDGIAVATEDFTAIVILFMVLVQVDPTCTPAGAGGAVPGHCFYLRYLYILRLNSGDLRSKPSFSPSRHLCLGL